LSRDILNASLTAFTLREMRYHRNTLFFCCIFYW